MGERAKWQTAVKGRINERSGERRNVTRSGLSGKFLRSFESGLESNRLENISSLFESSPSLHQTRIDRVESAQVRVESSPDSTRIDSFGTLPIKFART